jgi:hypothetical protein
MNEETKQALSNLYSVGKSFDYIQGYLDNQGIVIKIDDIRIHFLKHYNKSRKDLNEALRIEAEISKGGKVEILDFDKFLSEFGLTYSQVINVETNLDANVTAIQNIINLLLLKNLALANERIEECFSSDRRYPKDFILGLKALSEIHCRYLGVDIIINANQAIKTIEAQGYQISQIM